MEIDSRILHAREAAKHLRVQSSSDLSVLASPELQLISDHPAFKATLTYTLETFKDERRGGEVPYILHPFDVALSFLGLRVGYAVTHPKRINGESYRTSYPRGHASRKHKSAHDKELREKYEDPYLSLLQTFVSTAQNPEEAFARVFCVSFNHDTLEHRAQGQTFERLYQEREKLESYLVSRGTDASFADIIVSDVFALSNYYTLIVKEAFSVLSPAQKRSVFTFAEGLNAQLESISSRISRAYPQFSSSLEELLLKTRRLYETEWEGSSAKQEHVREFEEEVRLLSYNLYLSDLSRYAHGELYAGKGACILQAVKLADATDNVTSFDTPDPYKIRRTFSKATLVADQIRDSLVCYSSSEGSPLCHDYLSQAVTELYCAIVQSIRLRHQSAKHFKALNPRYNQLDKPFEELTREARSALPLGSRIVTVNNSIYTH